MQHLGHTLEVCGQASKAKEHRLEEQKGMDIEKEFAWGENKIQEGDGRELLTD